MSSIISGYVEDLRPLECTARGMVSTSNWRASAEQRWVGAAATLPGDPKYHVRALCGRPSTLERPLPKVYLANFRPREHDNIILLELRQARGVLWQGTSRVRVREPAITSHEITDVPGFFETADFLLPSAVGHHVEAALLRWWNRGDYDLQSLNSVDIQCWAQLWLLGVAVRPKVIQLSLSLESITSYPSDYGGLLSRALFSQDVWGPTDNSINKYVGLLTLRLRLYRPQYRDRGMQSPIYSEAEFSCNLYPHDLFGLLCNMRSVCS